MELSFKNTIKIKMTSSLPSKIKPEQFAKYYGENWSNSPPEMKNVEYKKLQII
jgi:hypothetical protein